MQTHPPVADAAKITLLLLERGVGFILVGGAAAIAHGSATNTSDYDFGARPFALLALLDRKI